MQLFIKTCLLVGCLNLATAKSVEWMEILSSRIIAADSADNAVKSTAGVAIPELASQLGLNDLVTYVKKAGLVGALGSAGPFTVFGPTDDAFAKLPECFVKVLEKNVTLLGEILKYHVASGIVLSGDLKNDMLIPTLQGSSIRINIYDDNKIITASGRPITLPDQKASNGVIHEVSGVLFPAAGTLTDVISTCPIFTTLLKLVKKAGLEDTLGGAGPFTLFAPSDKAFAKIPEKCIAYLMDNVKFLTKILTYHVVPSTQYSAGLKCGEKVKTLEGSSVMVTKIWGVLGLNFYARISYADATVTNGVMHVIDEVLIPYGANEWCNDVSNYAGSTVAEDVHSAMSKTLLQ